MPNAKRATRVRTFADLPDVPAVRARREIQPTAKRGLVTAWLVACGSRCMACEVHMIRPRPG